MSIPNKGELQQIAYKIAANIDSREFIIDCKNGTKEQ